MIEKRFLWLFSLLVVLAGCISCGGGQGNNAQNVVPDFDRQRAFADLVAQCDFGPRNPGSEGHTRCLEWLVEQLKGADRLLRQDFRVRTAFGGPYDFTNVLALFGQDRPGVPFLLCAHWDTRPVADEDPDPTRRNQPILGANDGASGVAVLLEIARALRASPPPRPIMMALLDAEDSGRTGSALPYQGFCLGAQYLAEHWPEDWAKPAEGILLDLVGADNLPNPRLQPPRNGANSILDFRQELHSLQYNRPLVERVWTIARQRGHTAFVPAEGLAIIDDHLPLNEGGIRVIVIIDFPPEEWHTTDDTPAHCSPDALYQVGDTLLHLIYREDN